MRPLFEENWPGPAQVGIAFRDLCFFNNKKTGCFYVREGLPGGCIYLKNRDCFLFKTDVEELDSRTELLQTHGGYYFKNALKNSLDRGRARLVKYRQLTPVNAYPKFTKLEGFKSVSESRNRQGKRTSTQKVIDEL